jgi:hypothetical protein
MYIYKKKERYFFFLDAKVKQQEKLKKNEAEA